MRKRPKPKCGCCRWRNGKLRSPYSAIRINEASGDVLFEERGWTHPSAPIAHGANWRKATGIRAKDGGAT